MARNASPTFQIEVQNVQIDSNHYPNNENSSIETLESYVETLNANGIPHFLSHLSNPKNPENFTENEKLSSLEHLIRIQGRKIAPHINTIITILLQIISLSQNASSYLHETCSNLISSISQYGIDPLAPETDKIRVLSSLIIPLSDQLMSSQESIRSICALCIKALVETDNWKYTPDELVDQICSKLAGALEEEFCRTNSHLELVISLVTLNSLIIEPYSRSILRSGLSIFTNSGPHMKLIAIEMINSLMKFVDSRAISSEIGNIIEVIENFEIESVSVAVGICSELFEALETARSIGAKLEFEFEKSSSPIVGLIVKSSPKSLMEFDNISEPPPTKEQRFCGSGVKQVSGFGSRVRYSLDALEGCRTGEETGRCSIHEKCNSCKAPNSLVWNSQRLKRNNSVDNLRIVSYPNKVSPNLGLHQDQDNSKFVHYEGNPKQDSSSKSKEWRMMNGSPNQDCLPCKVCHKENKREIMSKKDWRYNKFACIVVGVFVVIFAVIFRVCLVDLDEEVYLVPT